MGRLLIANAAQLVTVAGSSPRRGEAMSDLKIFEDGRYHPRQSYRSHRQTAQFEDFSDIEFINAGGSWSARICRFTYSPDFCRYQRNEYEQRSPAQPIVKLAEHAAGFVLRQEDKPQAGMNCMR